MCTYRALNRYSTVHLIKRLPQQNSLRDLHYSVFQSKYHPKLYQNNAQLQPLGRAPGGKCCQCCRTACRVGKIDVGCRFREREVENR